MTITKDNALQRQIEIDHPLDVSLESGGNTRLVPARWVPVCASSPVLSLDGDWSVVRWPFDAPEGDLLSGKAADSRHEKIAQPGPVYFYDPEQSPDSIPNWDRVTLAHMDPLDGAILYRTVSIPAGWSGQSIRLRFEGIYPAGVIYWDGVCIGEQYSGLTPMEIDLNEHAHPGQCHVLAVRLFRTHPFVQLDMPRHALEFTGISRQAFLHCVPPTHVEDLELRPTFNPDTHQGTLAGELHLAHPGSANACPTLHASLTDRDGVVVVEQALSCPHAADGRIRVPFSLEAGCVRAWNDERPELYTLTIRLSCPGQTVQSLVRRIGFRHLDLTGGRPRLNGNPVKFRGVNHLTYHPESGMFTPEAWLRKCLNLMKKANINAIRTHFFSPPELCDLCDELGFYLIQELPIDWGHTYVHKPEFFGPTLHRLAAGVRRDRNHACLMIWSIGNENMPRNEAEYPAFMENLHCFNRFVKTLDPTRPTLFPPPGPANSIRGIFEARLGDIADTHYSFDLVRSFNETGTVTNPRTWGMMPDGTRGDPTVETHRREELLRMGWSGVWFSSEYGINNLLTDLTNAPYTSIIADIKEDPLSGKNSQQVFLDRLNREWGYMRDDPSCLGGAYFPWIAAGAGSTWGWVRWGEDADWGVVTADLLPKPAFWAMRTIFSPVRFPTRIAWKPGDTELFFRIHNDYNRLDLSECILRTQMAGGPPYMGSQREWRDVPMSGAPGTTATVRVPIWKPASLNALQAGKPIICRCTVLDPTGYRPILVDILVVPESVQDAGQAVLPVGPDAIL